DPTPPSILNNPPRGSHPRGNPGGPIAGANDTEREPVKAFLQLSGSEGLPLVLVDGVTAVTGRYPDRAQLAKWAGIAPEPVAAPAAIQMLGLTDTTDAGSTRGPGWSTTRSLQLTRHHRCSDGVPGQKSSRSAPSPAHTTGVRSCRCWPLNL
ncbi:arsenic metallochaperone ArsD family protein, partial [Gordonia amicalis]|uniref:arsenic metallochaperone ArsD family protein n=1 Tax=Gordonia amicalis TaxID=89053 RepID=UPI00399D77C8